MAFAARMKAGVRLKSDEGQSKTPSMMRRGARRRYGWKV